MRNSRGLGIVGGIVGLVLILAGLYLLASTGAFAFVGLAGFFNGTYLTYVIYDAVGGILVVAGIVTVVMF